MDEEEFLKCRILGFIAPEILSEYLDFITRQCDDDMERISRVARETFLAFPTMPRMAEMLYEIDDEYAIGYMCMFSANNPGVFPRVVNDFLLFFFNRFPPEEIRRRVTRLSGAKPLGMCIFGSRIASSWIKANRDLVHAQIESEPPDLHERLCVHHERWKSILLSWGMIL